MGIIAVLVVIFVAFKIMFTPGKGDSILGLLVWFMIGMIILNAGFELFGAWYTGLSPFFQSLVIVGAVIAATLFVASRLVSRETRSHLNANLLHELIWFLVTLPFRAIRAIFRILFPARERVRLQRSNNLDRNWIERGPHGR